jgi:hypothetical protein
MGLRRRRKEDPPAGRFRLLKKALVDAPVVLAATVARDAMTHDLSVPDKRESGHTESGSHDRIASGADESPHEDSASRCRSGHRVLDLVRLGSDPDEMDCSARVRERG